MLELHYPMIQFLIKPIIKCVSIAKKQHVNVVKNILFVFNYSKGFTSAMNVWVKLHVSSILLILTIFLIYLINHYMNTVEADQIIKEYLENQKRQKQLQIMQLRNNLKTFTLKELKKEIIKMISLLLRE